MIRTIKTETNHDIKTYTYFFHTAMNSFDSDTLKQMVMLFNTSVDCKYLATTSHRKEIEEYNLHEKYIGQYKIMFKGEDSKIDKIYIFKKIVEVESNHNIVETINDTIAPYVKTLTDSNVPWSSDNIKDDIKMCTKELVNIPSKDRLCQLDYDEGAVEVKNKLLSLLDDSISRNK